MSASMGRRRTAGDHRRQPATRITTIASIIGQRKESVMIDRATLCQKIQEIYPDIGECGIDVNAEYDEERKAWVVHLKRDDKELKTYLEDEDAEKCMNNIQCIGLGIEIAQLKGNIDRLPDDR
jgi:hypothetical protein